MARKTDAALPECLPHRTNFDTQAFATGRLTVGVFETARAGGAIDILQIRRPALPALLGHKREGA